MRKILITGCGGMLGQAAHEILKDEFELRATDIDLNEPWLSPLDIRKREEVEQAVTEWKPDIVFHLAAHTDMEFCERNADEAYLTNAVGTEFVALACQRADIPMAYIGTAGIFDGKQDVYNEYDEPHPLSVYAKAKLGGEHALYRHLPKSFIFRAGWMMGGGPAKDKKFVGKIIRQLRAGKKELRVVDDKLGSPTYTFDFIRSMIEVVKSGQYGLYHNAGQGECSRYDVAERLLAVLGLTDSVRLVKISSDEIKAEYFAPRPPSEKLDNLKLRLRGMNRMRHWQESLDEYLRSHDWQIPR